MIIRTMSILYRILAFLKGEKEEPEAENTAFQTLSMSNFEPLPDSRHSDSNLERSTNEGPTLNDSGKYWEYFSRALYYYNDDKVVDSFNVGGINILATENNNKERAIAMLEEIINSPFSTFHLLIMVLLGEWYLAENYIEKAKQILNKAILGFEKYGFIYEHYYFLARFHLAKIYYKNESNDEAQKLLNLEINIDEILHINPLELKIPVEVLSEGANLLRYRVVYSENQVLYYEHDIKNILKSQYINIKIMLAQTFRIQRNYDKAILILNEISNQFADFLPDTREQGYIYIELGSSYYGKMEFISSQQNLIRCINYFETLNLQYNNAYKAAISAYCQVVDMMHRNEDDNFAEQCLVNAQNLNAGSDWYPWTLFYAGLYYSRLNKFIRAKELFNKAKDVYVQLGHEGALRAIHDIDIELNKIA